LLGENHDTDKISEICFHNLDRSTAGPVRIAISGLGASEKDYSGSCR
jgi:hypothetical protein